MANEKRLIDKDAFFSKMEKSVELLRQGKIGEIDVSLIIASMPTVDAVEVIRCRDCKYFSRDEENNRAWCNYYTGCIETAVNGYCYHGKKMDGGNDDV